MRISRKQMDEEIGGEFLAELRVRAYRHPYGVEFALSDGQRFLKLNGCNCDGFRDGKEDVARVMHDGAVLDSKFEVERLSSALMLLCGERVPLPVCWDECSKMVKDMRRSEAAAVFNKFSVLEERPRLPEWEVETGEQDPGAEG